MDVGNSNGPILSKRKISQGFIQYLEQNDHLSENWIIRSDRAKKLLASYKAQFGITQFSFSSFCRISTFYKLLRKGDNGILHINGAALSALNEEKVAEGTHKKKNIRIVSNSVTFKSAKTKQTIIDDLLKKLPTKVLKRLYPDTDLFSAYKERQDLTVFNWNGLTARVVGHTSMDNVVLAENVRNIIVVEIANTHTEQIHTIEDLRSCFPDKNIKAGFPPPPIILNPGRKFIINITAKVPNTGDYLQAFTMTHGSGKILAVRLVLRVLSPVVAGLQATKPYKKTNRSIYTETIDKIVPGERPKSCMKRPQGYTPPGNFDLPATLITVLNRGVDFEGITPQQKEEQLRVRELLNVPDKSNALTSGNYTKLLTLLLQIEEHQMLKDIHDYDKEDQILEKCRGSRLLQLEVPGLAEHRPSIVYGDKVFIKETKESTTKYEGFVHQVLDKAVCLRFNSEFHNQVFVENKKFFVSFTFNRHPIRMEHQAVQLTQNHKIAGQLFNISCPHPEGPVSIIEYNWVNKQIGANKEQKQAVHHILNKSSYPAPYIIFGPPGTGKTATLTEAIMQIYLTQPKSKMVVLAPSNSAANELAKRIIKHVSKSDLFRYMAISYPYKHIPEEVTPYVNYQGGEFFYPSIEMLSKYRILVSTLMNIGQLVNLRLPPNTYDYVLVDECGQATETETLVGLAGIISSEQEPAKLLGQLVLVGDPKQLGPMIHSKLAIEYGFETSMLERLMNTVTAYKKLGNGHYNPLMITKLVNNYRSHNSILKVPNELFYDNELVSKGDNLINVALRWEYLPNPAMPVIFHSIRGMDQKEENSPSFFNLQEMTCVLDYMKKLLGTRMSGIEISEEHIGIIAPYKKQVQKIQQACKQLGYNMQKLMIGSVEQLQGQERLIIIMSTTRSTSQYLPLDHKFHLGFLRNPKRTNVALTRAKALLIVIGNPDILRHDSNMRRFIEYCQANNCTTGESFELDEPDLDDLISRLNSVSSQDSASSPEGTADFSRGQQ